MDANGLIALFGGSGAILIAAFTGYHFYKKTESSLPPTIEKLRQVEDKQKDIINELDKTKIKISHVEEKLNEFKKVEEEHFRENKKKNEITESSLQDLKLSLAKLDNVPLLLDRILSKIDGK